MVYLNVCRVDKQQIKGVRFCILCNQTQNLYLFQIVRSIDSCRLPKRASLWCTLDSYEGSWMGQTAGQGYPILSGRSLFVVALGCCRRWQYFHMDLRRSLNGRARFGMIPMKLLVGKTFQAVIYRRSAKAVHAQLPSK